MSDISKQIRELARLRDEGVLDDAQFASAKADVLAGTTSPQQGGGDASQPQQGAGPAPAPETVRFALPPAHDAAPPSAQSAGHLPPHGGVNVPAPAPLPSHTFQPPPPQARPRTTGRRVLFSLLIIVLIAGGGLGGYLAIDTVAGRGTQVGSTGGADDRDDGAGEGGVDAEEGEEAAEDAASEDEVAAEDEVADEDEVAEAQEAPSAVPQDPAAAEGQLDEVVVAPAPVKPDQAPDPVGAQQVPGCAFDVTVVDNWGTLSDLQQQAIAPLVRFATSHNANATGVPGGSAEARPLDCAWDSLSTNYRTVHGLQRSTWDASQSTTSFPRWTVQSIVVSGATASIDVEFVSSQRADLGPDGQPCTRWLLSYRLAETDSGTWLLDERTGFTGRFASDEC